jgi:hypothetical protein
MDKEKEASPVPRTRADCFGVSAIAGWPYPRAETPSVDSDKEKGLPAARVLLKGSIGQEILLQEHFCKIARQRAHSGDLIPPAFDGP